MTQKTIELSSEQVRIVAGVMGGLLGLIQDASFPAPKMTMALNHIKQANEVIGMLHEKLK